MIKKFIACLTLIIGLCFVTVSSANASMGAMAALQSKIGITVQLIKIPGTFDKYLGKHTNGSVWLYAVNKGSPRSAWIIKKIQIFK